jgi:hypothetical protein
LINFVKSGQLSISIDHAESIKQLIKLLKRSFLAGSSKPAEESQIGTILNP